MINISNNSANILFASLANEIRLRCLLLLQTQGELCVCELMHALKLSQPMVSRHLALLRKQDLVTDRRSGQWVYYQINPEVEHWFASVLLTTAEALIEELPYSDDALRLETMPNRPDAACCE